MKVLIQHRSKQTKSGVILEKTKKTVLRDIKAFYSGDEIMDSCGELWKVKPHHSNKADYETVTCFVKSESYSDSFDDNV